MLSEIGPKPAKRPQLRAFEEPGDRGVEPRIAAWRTALFAALPLMPGPWLALASEWITIRWRRFPQQVVMQFACSANTCSKHACSVIFLVIGNDSVHSAGTDMNR